MQATNLYPTLSDYRKNKIGLRSLRTILFFGVLCIGASAGAQTYDHGTVNGSGVYEQSMAICGNSSAVSINTLLTVSDATGLNETWSVNVAPGHGVLAGLPATVPSGAHVAPTGVTYAPSSGFTGVDSFKIQVNNGTQTAITNIIVTVNALPSPITGVPSVCAGGGTTTLSDATTGGAWSSSNANATVAGGLVTGVTPGTSVITYTLPTTCSASATVTVHPLPTISGGADVAICFGSSTPLTATGGGAYSWAPSSGLSASTGANVTATPTVTTTYTVTGTGVSGSPITVSYNQNFTGGVSSGPSSPQGIAWGNFIASLSNLYVYSGFTVSGTYNTTGYTCTNPVVAQAIANALNTQTDYSGTSDGHTWGVRSGAGVCVSGGGFGVEFYVDGSSCSCGSLASIRPWINNSNWGGVNAVSCPPPTQNMQLNFFGTAPCTNSATVTVTVNPLPTISTTVGSGTAICDGSTTTITATGGVDYSWAPATDLSATTGASVDANPTTETIYTITGTDVNGCTNTGTIDVTVNPLPAPITGSLNFCLTSIVTLSDASSGGTWSSTNTAVAMVNGTTGEVSGVTTGVDTIIYTLPTGCTAMVSGTVNPISDVATVTDQTICNGASTTPVAFTGSVPGTIFNWDNSNSSIGLGASGTGDILSFSAIDTSFSPVTATVNVAPSNNGCPGTVGTFHITVNPTPDVFATNPPQTLCNNTMTLPITFAGDVAGTIFTWTNTDSSIGIGGSGTGDINPFTGIDTSALPVTATITVGTSAAGCTGSSNSFTITIDPTPLLSSTLTPHSICDLALFDYTPMSATPGTTFTWNRAAIIGITNPAMTGADDPMENLENTTTAPLTVSYQYALMAYGCADTQYVSVVVNPKPMLTSSLTPPAVCDSTVFHYVPSSATTGVAYAWSRASVTGISNAANSGTDSITEYLVNTTPEPVTVLYAETLTLDGCSNTQFVSVAVNPKPILTTPLSLPQVCDSTTITYVPHSATTGTTFTWSRAAIVGNPAASGGDTISERLVNTTTASAIITYVDTLKANGCSNTQTITIRVMPHPVLSSTLTPTGLCDSATFNYTPASATAGTQFAWVRPFVLGIGRPAGSGTGNPNEQLINTTNDNLNVTYVYTLNDSGCTNTQNVTVVVHPTPVLSSDLNPSVCSGAQFVYGPSSFTYGTTFKWSRGKVASLSPATDTGSGISIVETLVDSLLTPIRTSYDITLTANGCPHHQTLYVTVNPAPAVTLITTHPDTNPLCSNTLFQNFGAATMPPAGQAYTWNVHGCDLYGEGVGHQYSLINFKTTGTATITLNTRLAGFSCISSNTLVYNVTSDVSEMPEVIYFEGQFICRAYDRDTYQWGYDDAITLDSTAIPGEINPNYFINYPDLQYKYYWVMTTHNGCSQKSYFNIPSGVNNVNTQQQGEVKVYPNPANDVLNVAISSSVTGKVNIEVMNMLGQKVMADQTTDNKAALDVAALPAGAYMVVCYRGGDRIAAVRFVKN